MHLTVACKTCRFRVGNMCRRFPPTPLPAVPGGFSSAFNATFPAVSDDWWCGEHQQILPSQE